MNDYGHDENNYNGKGWPNDDCYYGNDEETLKEKVEFEDARKDDANTWIFGYCDVGCNRNSSYDTLPLT